MHSIVSNDSKKAQQKIKKILRLPRLVFSDHLASQEQLISRRKTPETTKRSDGSEETMKLMSHGNHKTTLKIALPELYQNVAPDGHSPRNATNTTICSFETSTINSLKLQYPKAHYSGHPETENAINIVIGSFSEELERMFRPAFATLSFAFLHILNLDATLLVSFINRHPTISPPSPVPAEGC
ncbi:hypothetical protein C8J56DRAFT_1075377 [Mycena floridula]|nr:hypothetical protein C8J56DRAFT_1075377 [Mycena floridula]